MFDGGEQFHQFMASSRTSLPIPLSFPLHGNPSFSAAFDPYAPPLHHHDPPPSKNLTPPIDSKHVLVHKYPLISTNLALESDRSTDPWSNDELLSLLKVRSSMEIWFPDFTWEHVSRKLGELGFKRSGEQCKEKFEEESRHFNSKNYRILSELDEFYHEEEDEDDDNDQEQEHQPVPQISDGRDSHPEMDQEKVVLVEESMIDSRNAAENEENPSQEEANHGVKQPPTTAVTKKLSKKRKRRDKFEMFKGFCEAVVSKMMSKQEELHNRLIEDMLKMDREKVARDEAWKNQEMDRVKTEIETRSKEQKSAAERQATIIGFLKQFTDSHQDSRNLNNIELIKTNNNNTNNSNSNSNSSSSYHDVETPSMICQAPSFPSQTSPTKTPSPSSPSSSILAAKNTDHITPPPPPSAGDVGRRWPRDEVLALINLRCKMSSSINAGDHESKEGSNSKGPLWERISQGMMELGYKRNAKRCKEKWENINKYFRKTKDSSKKRSVNSRTCPYFHQLSCLYSDGTIVAPAAMPENLQ